MQVLLPLALRQAPCLFTDRMRVGLRGQCAVLRSTSDKRHLSRQDLETTGFQLYTTMEYGYRPEDFCQHSAEIVVNETPSHCFKIWNHWDNLVDFLSLVGQLAKHPNDTSSVVLFCYYHYGYSFLLQIMTKLQKTDVKENESIKFASIDGMPLRGIVEFEEQDNNKTRVNLRFEHPLPEALMSLRIGTLGVETHLQRILNDDMETFKKLAEGQREFSKEKYNTQRFWSNLHKMRDAFSKTRVFSDSARKDLLTFEEHFKDFGDSDLLLDEL